MAYIGRSLTSGNYLKLDDISSQFNGTTTTFNLTSGGNLFYPGSSFSLLVSLSGVIQEPESAYTIDEYQITFASAPGVSDDFFCIVLGVALGIGVPGEGTVSTTKLQDDSVTAEKLSPDALDNINATTLVVSGISTLGVATISTLTVTEEVGFTTTSSLQIPSGTSSERPVTPVAGMIRYNSENAQFEGYATAWGGFGGASGSSGNAVFYENDTNVTDNYTITTGKNAMSAGPITLDAGVVVTIPAGSVWTVV